MKKNHYFLGAFLLFLPLMLLGWEIRPSAPADGATLPLLSPAQKAHLRLPRAERVAKFSNHEYRKKLAKASWRPLPVYFSFKSDAPKNTRFTLLLSETPDFSKTDRINFKGQAKLKVENFKIAQRYYWKIEGKAADGTTVSSKIFSFTTEDVTPRLLRFPSTPNVRDLGGYKTLDGRRVKQGMAIRSSGMNYNATQERVKSPEAWKSLRPELQWIANELLQNAQRKSASVRIIPGKFSPQWTLFVCNHKGYLSRAEEKEVMALKKIPGQFWGSKPERIAEDPQGYVRLTDRTDPRPSMALLMQEYQSPADGWLSIACGADWHWALYVNGHLILDRTEGNAKGASADSHPILVPVRKGRNMVVVTLVNGINGWHFGSVANPLKNAAAIRLLAAENQQTFRELPLGKVIPGRNHVTPEGYQTFVVKFGVRSDIDLRTHQECRGMTGSPLGEKVTWFFLPSSSYDGLKTPFGKASFARVFRIFLEEKNYPIIFHCIAGQDRTGSIALIINALLGVPEEQLCLDWEATGFWNPEPGLNHQQRFFPLLRVFESYPGKNLNEKVEAYVLSAGFTKDDIAKLRSIMLE